MNFALAAVLQDDVGGCGDVAGCCGCCGDDAGGCGYGLLLAAAVMMRAAAGGSGDAAG